jgi:hypothetical protein
MWACGTADYQWRITCDLDLHVISRTAQLYLLLIQTRKRKAKKAQIKKSENKKKKTALSIWKAKTEASFLGDVNQSQRKL